MTTPSAAGAGAFEVAVAAVAESSGTQGTFAASSLSPAGTWSSSGNSGSFSWSYPIAVPPSAAGGAPTVSLSYGSSAVDGLTSGTNNQSSWIGLGWSYSPGFIERTFRTCSEDIVDSPPQTSDLCWNQPNVTFSLGGKSTPLVWNGTKWKPETDDGEIVELATDGDPGALGANGARHGERWKITTADGTEYWFGRHKLPGATNQEATNSAWTVPVAHPGTGDSCQVNTLTQPHCARAWRWNLDYVRDTHGNATAYYYDKETNLYGANNATTGVSYTRGGWPKRIDYGLRETNGSIYGSVVPNTVKFKPTGRCTNSDPETCASVPLTTANQLTWRDVPVDQKCDASPCNTHGPTFWLTCCVPGLMETSKP
ncbi:type IV secretion protein Rhs, partial [Actinokineospora sp. HBU206404]|nr:type IV secretion protein Rhs [Actinokineospora xionganensis]